jgi:hypothetical protein
MMIVSFVLDCGFCDDPLHSVDIVQLQLAGMESAVVANASHGTLAVGIFALLPD